MGLGRAWQKTKDFGLISRHNTHLEQTADRARNMHSFIHAPSSGHDPAPLLDAIKHVSELQSISDLLDRYKDESAGSRYDIAGKVVALLEATAHSMPLNHKISHDMGEYILKDPVFATAMAAEPERSISVLTNLMRKTPPQDKPNLLKLMEDHGIFIREAFRTGQENYAIEIFNSVHASYSRERDAVERMRRSPLFQAAADNQAFLNIMHRGCHPYMDAVEPRSDGGSTPQASHE